MKVATATLGGKQPATQDTRFFMMMSVIMSLIIVAGFSLNLAMGRSTFDVPWQYHFHGIIFMGWIALYLGQNITIVSGNHRLHASLGKIAYAYVPLMVGAGTVIMITVAQLTGGPFFFDVNEFLVSNLALIWCFGGLSFWALRQRRYTGWHRRLMLCAMAMLTGPGLGRLLPLPLLIPYAWEITTAATWLFPVAGMIADKRASGRVHPAYWYGLGIYVTVFTAAMVLANSPAGYAFTDWVIAGTPGADRPNGAFLPEGFAM
jgi:hypothetical protein